jgi:hypothetical protein
MRTGAPAAAPGAPCPASAEALAWGLGVWADALGACSAALDAAVALGKAVALGSAVALGGTLGTLVGSAGGGAVGAACVASAEGIAGAGGAGCAAAEAVAGAAVAAALGAAVGAAVALAEAEAACACTEAGRTARAARSATWAHQTPRRRTCTQELQRFFRARSSATG